MQKITSRFLSLNQQDFAKGLIVSAASAGITIIKNTLEAGSLTFDWKNIESVALAAGVAYLTKQFFTPAKAVTPVQ